MATKIYGATSANRLKKPPVRPTPLPSVVKPASVSVKPVVVPAEKPVAIPDPEAEEIKVLQSELAQLASKFVTKPGLPSTESTNVKPKSK